MRGMGWPSIETRGLEVTERHEVVGAEIGIDEMVARGREKGLSVERADALGRTLKVLRERQYALRAE